MHPKLEPCAVGRESVHQTTLRAHKHSPIAGSFSTLLHVSRSQKGADSKRQVGLWQFFFGRGDGP